MFKNVVFVAVLFFPLFSYADVYISEIAWMGDSESHTNEWIEVHNSDATSVDLSGWRINAVDGAPTFDLSGTIGPGAYKVFDRSAGDYTGALSNSGETLELVNFSGSVVDRVVGGTDWGNIGGDNTTKETPQYTINGWITATPTKGSETTASNSSENTNEENTQEDDSEDENTSSISSSSNTVYVYANIQASVTHAVVGMPIRFEGYKEASEKDNKPSYRWNFGDGTTGRGSVIHHMYSQPGSYVVSLEASRRGKEEKDEIVITISEPSISISSVETDLNGFVEISNSSGVRIDVSGWRLQTSIDSFSFPNRSFIAPRSTLRITNDVLMLEGMQKLELIDAEGNLATAYPGSEEVIPGSFFDKPIAPKTTGAITSTKNSKNDITQIERNNLATAGLSASPSNSGQIGLWIWISGLIAIIVVAATVLFLFPKKRKNKIGALSADDIEILE